MLVKLDIQFVEKSAGQWYPLINKGLEVLSKLLLESTLQSLFVGYFPPLKADKY